MIKIVKKGFNMAVEHNNQKPKIVVVDDDSTARDILEAVLISDDYNITVATNGNEALEKAIEIKPDLILLDIIMPGMDGFEVCKKIRENPVLGEVPVIMITGLGDRNSRIRGIECGADDFISKPFDGTELKARVKTITRLNRYRRLDQERAKFEWVVEKANDGYVIIDENDNIFYANPKARLYLEISDEYKDTFEDTFINIAKRQYNFEPESIWKSWPDIDKSTKNDDNITRYLVRPESSNEDAIWLNVELIEMSDKTSKRFLIRLTDVSSNLNNRRFNWSVHNQISHKLKTPLNLLNGIMDLLRLKQDSKNFDDFERFINIANKNAKRLQDSIMSIFKYINALHSSGSYGNACLISEIDNIIKEISMELEIKDINIEYTDINKDTSDLTIKLTKQSIDMILLELFENAKKFHPKKSPKLNISLKKESDNLIIQVSDDGLTISPIQLTKIWEPYFQAEKSHTGEIPGMGLGLSVVSSIIWGIGGLCKAYNNKDGGGLTIEIVIPIHVHKLGNIFR